MFKCLYNLKGVQIIKKFHEIFTFITQSILIWKFHYDNLWLNQTQLTVILKLTYDLVGQQIWF